MLSYKSYKLKNKIEESDNSNKTPPPAPPTTSPCNPKTNFSCTGASLSQKTDSTSCKIPFVPTPDEIKEHPIFSNFTSHMTIPSDIGGSIDVNVGVTDNTNSRFGDCSLNGSKVVSLTFLFDSKIKMFYYFKNFISLELIFSTKVYEEHILVRSSDFFFCKMC